MTIILIVAFNAFDSKSQNVIVIDKLPYYILYNVENRKTNSRKYFITS